LSTSQLLDAEDEAQFARLRRQQTSVGGNVDACPLRAIVHDEPSEAGYDLYLDDSQAGGSDRRLEDRHQPIDPRRINGEVVEVTRPAADLAVRDQRRSASKDEVRRFGQLADDHGNPPL